MFREAERAGGGVDEAARGLMGVAQQALAQGQRIDRQGQAIDHGMPAQGNTLLDGLAVALQGALVAQRAQFLELGLADALAWGCEPAQARFVGQLLIKSDQFTYPAADGVLMGGLDGRQFEREEDFLLVGQEESA